ncbi:MAG: hypothetical protein CMH79_05105 [Nitrospinae bacterium]|nr:hypothetical protein [Nitrospinota bacterium]
MAAPWIAKLFGGLLGKADKIIDEVVTSKEEKLTLKNELQDILLKSEAELQKNVTERWKADMASDSWLSKNVRPMVLIFLVTSTVLMVFIDAGSISFEVEEKWTDLLQLTLITVIGAYFGGRSVEKVKNTNKK